MKEKFKTQKTKSIIFGILVGIVAFPTITLGGTFVSSLIQGKTVEEAVQILAEQIDSLIGRVEVLEVKQSELETQQSAFESQQLKQELWQEKQEACKYADELNYSIPPIPEGVRGGIYNSSCQEFIQSLRWPGFYPRPAIAKGYSLDTIEAIYNYEKDCPEHPDLDIIKPAYDEYLQAKQECDNLIEQYNSLE